MDLTARLRRFSFARPHLLVVAAPAAVETRLAVERYARERGWPAAESPADADVLAVVGSSDVGLASTVAVLESQIPTPWIRVDLLDASSVVPKLDAAPDQLAAWSPDPTAAGGSGSRPKDSGGGEHGGPGEHGRRANHRELGEDGGFREDREQGEHGGHRERPTPHASEGREGAAHEMGGHEMGGHEMGGGHEHHMGAVAGLPMADRAPDRDGLKLDVLHVPLGPVLPYWPPGLRLSLAVQGDVVQEAVVETVGVAVSGPSFWDQPVVRALAGDRVRVGDIARRRAASHLDSLMRLLGVAGWDGPAMRCAVLRDGVLDGEPAGPLTEMFRPLARRVAGSRSLRRMTEGLGDLNGRACDHAGVSGPAAVAAGDVWARLQQWVRSAAEDLARSDDDSWVADVEGPRGRLDLAEPPSLALLGVLPELLVGAELAGVRLIVASLDPDLAELASQPAVTAHG